jgi:hypothetical protein
MKRRALVFWMLALALSLGAAQPLSAQTKTADYREESGFLWGASTGYGIWRRDIGPSSDIVDPLHEGRWITDMEFGYRIKRIELSAAGRVSADKLSAGLEGLYRIPVLQKAHLMLGAGIHWAFLDERHGIEFIIPRIEARFPISASWELALTLARLSYTNTTWIQINSDFEGDIREAWTLTSGIGLKSRIGPRSTHSAEPSGPQGARVLAPLPSGVTIGVNHIIGLVHPVSQLGQEHDPTWTRFIALEPSLGYRLNPEAGYLEIGIPVSLFNFTRAGYGLSLMWRFKAFPLLGLGVQALYLPKQYVLVEIPRLMLFGRITETTEFFFHLVGLYFLVEPGRDVWVEHGFESKVPYWGFFFGAGLRWTVPVHR